MDHVITTRGILISILIILLYFIAAILRWLGFKRENKFFYYLINIRANLFLGFLILAIILMIFTGIYGDDRVNDLLNLKW